MDSEKAIDAEKKGGNSKDEYVYIYYMIIYKIERIFRKEVSQMKRTSPNSVVLLQRTA